MSAAHTPGPWFCAPADEWKTYEGQHVQFSKYNISAGSTDVRSDDYYLIAIVSNVNDSSQNAGNTQLIKSAPLMLDALRRAALALAFAAESSKAMQDDYEAVSAAIAAATGATA